MQVLLKADSSKFSKRLENPGSKDHFWIVLLIPDLRIIQVQVSVSSNIFPSSRTFTSRRKMHKYFPELVDKFLKTLLLSLFGYHFLPDTDSWKTNFFAEPKSSRYDSLTKLSRWKIPWSTALFTLDHFGLLLNYCGLLTLLSRRRPFYRPEAWWAFCELSAYLWTISAKRVSLRIKGYLSVLVGRTLSPTHSYQYLVF